MEIGVLRSFRSARLNTNHMQNSTRIYPFGRTQEPGDERNYNSTSVSQSAFAALLDEI